MITAPTAFTWRHFENIPSGADAATVAASCAFSLATLEVTSLHDFSGFALTERKQPEVWRWAVIGQDGSILEEGCEPTQADAKRSAVEALNIADEVVEAVPAATAADPVCSRAFPAAG
jgi:hypothetical protein